MARGAVRKLAVRLTARQLEVLSLSYQGLRPKDIAVELVISVETVRAHVKEIYRRLGVHNVMAAVAEAKRLGLLIEGRRRRGGSST